MGGMQPQTDPSEPMTITLQLSAEAERKLRELAAQEGKSLAEYLEQLVERTALGVNGATTGDDALLDTEYLAACAREADPSITLEAVRQALAIIPGSMTEDFIAERDER